MSNNEKQVETAENEQLVEGEIVDQVSDDASDDASDESTSQENEVPTVEALLEEVIALRESNNDLKDRFTRARAETENTRRISTKEVDKARKFALQGFARELLQVKDSLDQAAQVDLSHNVTKKLAEQMSEGLQLTLKQLDGVFERFKIEVVCPEAGDVLNPELHQAMTRQPSDEVDANKVVSTLQTGYTLNGRLLRPAMVIVSSG